MKKTLKTQNELIQKQQARIEELERRMAASAPSPQPQPPAIGQIGAVLPEIGVLGDIVATASESKSDEEGNNRVAAREVELVLGNYVDPYSRYDATISFSDFEEVGLEEAYLTRWGLPFDLKGRVGRFFPRIGKAASSHRDSLDSVDEPLVVEQFFGAEGLKRSGVDFTRVLEGPFGLVLEPSVGVLEGGVGEGGNAFGSARRRPTFYEHLKARFEVNVLGTDLTYLRYFTPTRKLKLQGEAYVQSRKEAFTVDGSTDERVQFDRRPWGAYVLADYRFAPRWSVGARADQVRVVDAVAPRHADQGLGAWLTFYQSEFARCA